MAEPTYGLQHVTKMCGKCRWWKAISAYYIDRSRRDGLTPLCILCLTGVDTVRQPAKGAIRNAA